MTVKWIEPGGNCADALKVRTDVFVKEQGYPTEEEYDDMDEKSWHVVLYDNSLPVAVGRMYSLEKGVYKLGRIAVEKRLRKTGLGERIMREMMQRAVELGAHSFSLSAQTHAQGFYEKLGFTAYGEVYMEGHVPHIAMKRKAY